MISFDYSWFLAKNLSNFVSLPWKFHNPYCHKYTKVSGAFFIFFILLTEYEKACSSEIEAEDKDISYFQIKVIYEGYWELFTFRWKFIRNP